MSVADFIGEAVISLWNGNHQGKKLDDDEVLANGTVNPNQTLKPGVLKPSQWKKELGAMLVDYSSRGKLTTLIQDVDASVASIRAVKTGSRVECSFDLAAIDHAHQLTTLISETSGG